MPSSYDNILISQQAGIENFQVSLKIKMRQKAKRSNIQMHIFYGSSDKNVNWYLYDFQGAVYYFS